MKHVIQWVQTYLMTTQDENVKSFIVIITRQICNEEIHFSSLPVFVQVKIGAGKYSDIQLWFNSLIDSLRLGNLGLADEAKQDYNQERKRVFTFQS